MEYGPLVNFIMKDIGEGKEFWVSGYANPKLRHSPATNIKPCKVTLVKNSKEKPYRVGVYESDRKFEYYIAKTDKDKIIPANANVYVYDTQEEATIGYNMNIDIVVGIYQERINKIMVNKIGN